MPANPMFTGRPLLRGGAFLLLGSVLLLGACKRGGEGGPGAKEGGDKGPEAIPVEVA